mgnify:CR=1 FL=1
MEIIIKDGLKKDEVVFTQSELINILLARDYIANYLNDNDVFFSKGLDIYFGNSKTIKKVMDVFCEIGYLIDLDEFASDDIYYREYKNKNLLDRYRDASR